MSAILLSYRREDAAATAGRIADRLAAEFGRAAVSRDLFATTDGRADERTDARLTHERLTQIDEAVREASVVLVVIGSRWLASTGERGRLIDDPNDVVRLEVEAALRHNKPLLPLLVQGAAPPLADLLPPSIRELGNRLALTVRYDPDFVRDMGKVVTAVERWVPRLTPAQRAVRRATRLSTLAVVGGAILVALAVLGILLNNSTPTLATTRVPTPSGPLVVLQDPLTSNQHLWSTASYCKFAPDGFHVALAASMSGFCGSIADESVLAQGTISVTTKQVSSPSGVIYGIVFHIDDVNGDHSNYSYYRYYISSDGRWSFDAVANHAAAPLVSPTANPAIHAGVGAQNILTVHITAGASGASAKQTLTFLVNNVKVGQIDDDTYLAGNSGVGIETTSHAAGEVAFSNYVITVP
ncbi:MAG TPA: toll/interleukin-1 receptor domain-containing protein [Ktedonobacterales bacterium]